MTNYASPMPVPSAPLVDPRTGIVSDVWFPFLMTLFSRTGGAQGVGSTALQSAITAASSTPASSSSAAAALLSWPSAAGASIANGSYEIALSWPWPSGSVTSLTADAGNGAFTLALLKNGTTIPGLGAVVVNSPVVTTTKPGSNSLAVGDNLTLVVSGVTTGASGFSGDFGSDFTTSATAAPTDVTVQVNYLHPLITASGFGADFNPRDFISGA